MQCTERDHLSRPEKHQFFSECQRVYKQTDGQLHAKTRTRLDSVELMDLWCISKWSDWRRVGDGIFRVQVTIVMFHLIWCRSPSFQLASCQSGDIYGTRKRAHHWKEPLIRSITFCRSDPIAPDPTTLAPAHDQYLGAALAFQDRHLGQPMISSALSRGSRCHSATSHGPAQIFQCTQVGRKIGGRFHSPDKIHRLIWSIMWKDHTRPVLQHLIYDGCCAMKANQQVNEHMSEEVPTSNSHKHTPVMVPSSV